MTSGPPPLRDPAEVARRRAMLRAPRMAPLARYAAGLRGSGRVVPDLDPMDGGTAARLLILMEKPGPATDPSRGGSGFVSFDNGGGTAAAGRRFLGEAGIDRGAVAVWNTSPWWNGTIRFTPAERRAGLTVLPGFLDLMPNLRAAICVGRQAERAAGALEERGLAVFASAHPSPQVRAAARARWDEIPEVWRRAWAAANDAGPADPIRR